MSEQLDLFDQGPPRETPISTSSTHPAHSPIVVAKCLGAVNGAIINMVPGEQIIVADWQPGADVVRTCDSLRLFSPQELDARAVIGPGSTALVDNWLTENGFPHESKQIPERQLVAAALLQLNTKWNPEGTPVDIGWRGDDHQGTIPQKRVEGFRLTATQARLYVIPKGQFGHSEIRRTSFGNISFDSGCLLQLHDTTNPRRKVYIAHIDPKISDLYSRVVELQRFYKSDTTERLYKTGNVDIPNVSLETGLGGLDHFVGSQVPSKVVSTAYYEILATSGRARFIMNKNGASAQAYARMRVGMAYAAGAETYRPTHNVIFNKPFVCWLSDDRMEDPIIVFPVGEDGLKFKDPASV